MWAVVAVVSDVLGQYLLEMIAPEHQEPIEAPSADGTHEPVGAENVIRWAHAASSYSWSRPPSRSALRRCTPLGHVAGGWDIDSGAVCSSERCGRCWL